MRVSFDSKFFEVSGRIVDMMILSLFWVLLCLPLITIVPASIAMYYAAAKVIRRETGKLIPEFFRGLKENFRQGFALNVIYILLAGFLYVISQFAQFNGLGTAIGNLYYVFLLVCILVLACVTYYLLPILSRFQINLMGALRLSLYFGSKNLGTMIPLVITFAGFCAAVYVFPMLLMIAPGFYAYLMTKPIEATFRRYIREEMPNPEAHYGMWYMDEPALPGEKGEEE